MTRPLVTLTSLVVAGAALALLAASIAGYWAYTVDDAFITFRYARHWADGAGLSWNAGGPPQEGYTSVLHVAVMAVLSLLGAEQELASKLLGVTAITAALVLAARLGQRFARGPFLPSLATVLVGSVSAAHLLPVHAVAGLETTLFAALWMVLVVLSDEELVTLRRARAIGALCLLLGLCRPEGNLIALVTCSTILASAKKDERRGLGLQMLATYLVPAAVYFAWRWQHYGLLLPLPFYVKVASGSGPQGLGVAADFLRSLPLFVVLLAGVGLGHLALTRGRWRALRFGLPAAAFFTFFLWPEHVMGFDFRFFAPIVPLLLALASAGLLVACSRAWWLMPVGLTLFAAIALPWRTPGAQQAWAGSRFEAYAKGLAGAHRRVGAALLAAKNGWSHPDPLLAIADCGVIPFASDWRTLDTFGLNDSEFARLRPPRDHRFVESVFGARPDVLVLLSSNSATFTPLLEWEGRLAEAAHERGYELLSTVAFAPDYHLWLYTRPTEPGNARALMSSLGP